MLFVDVILPVPLDGLFTYSVPAELEGDIQPFVRVKVPFGITKTHTALVARITRETPEELRRNSEGSPIPQRRIKDIIAVLDKEPVLLPSQYKLWEWISSYYMCPLGDIFCAAFPQGIKKEEKYHPKTETYIKAPVTNLKTIQENLQVLTRSPKQLEVYTKYLEMTHLDTLEKDENVVLPEISREELTNASHATSAIIKALVDRGVLSLYDREIGRLNSGSEPHPERIKPLSEAQQAAFNQLSLTNSTNFPLPINGRGSGGGSFLLHGVTSSGKTEIYIHLIQEAIDRGEQVMYLLPEIALTVQITQRLQYVFGNRLGIYHSKYSDAERTEIWQKQLSDKPYDIILGARSAVFLPYQRLGLVIIDEEHETSFKQQDPAPRYHARSVAMMTAQVYTEPGRSRARVVLGTATPSAESYYNTTVGKYHLVSLTQRYKNLQLPHIQVVDVKDLRRRKIMRGLLSPQLEEAIREALNNGEQAIIFQNRRGFSPIIECHQCGWSPKCPNCDVSLTYHKTTNVLSCHYCGYTYRMPSACPDCGNTELRDRGAGTEKVEDIIAEMLP